jgi:hypothetical protein
MGVGDVETSAALPGGVRCVVNGLASVLDATGPG